MKKIIISLWFCCWLISVSYAATDAPMVGIWKIISFQMVGYPEMSEFAAVNWIGRTLEWTSRRKLTLRTATGGTATEIQVCPEATSQVSIQDASGYFSVGYRIEPQRMGILQKDVTVVTVGCKTPSWLGEKREFVLISDHLMLTDWEGIFFFFAKQADNLNLLSTTEGLRDLVVTPHSVNTLMPNSLFTQQTLVEAFPNHQIRELNMLNDEKVAIIRAYELYQGDQLKLKVYPDERYEKISYIEISDPQAIIPGNFKLGSQFADIFTSEQTIDCQAGIQNYAGQTICFLEGMKTIKFIFKPKEVEGLSPIEALNQAQLIGIIWYADPSLSTQTSDKRTEESSVPVQVAAADAPIVPQSVISVDPSETNSLKPELPFQQQDKRLAEVYQQIKEALTKVSQQENTEGPINLTGFIAAQKAWLEYRKESCQWLLTVGVTDKTGQCLAKVTQQRIEELEQILQSLQPG